MSAEFEKIMIQEFKKVNNKLDKLDSEVSELKQDVAGLKEDVAVLKTDVAGLKKDVSVLKTDVTVLKKEVKELKSDTKMLKNEVFNVVKPTLKSIEGKVDIMTNINTARILNEQNKNHKELMKKLEQYERKNELEHSRLNYEICKLKANA